MAIIKCITTMNPLHDEITVTVYWPVFFNSSNSIIYVIYNWVILFCSTRTYLNQKREKKKKKKLRKRFANDFRVRENICPTFRSVVPNKKYCLMEFFGKILNATYSYTDSNSWYHTFDHLAITRFMSVFFYHHEN